MEYSGKWATAEAVAEEENEEERFIGALTLRVRRSAEEVWVHGCHGSTVPPAAGDWTRWSVPASSELRLLPLLPDRPVVVAPEQPFYLPPLGEARVYVRIPLFVGLSRRSRSGDRTILTQLPSVVLSDTWWGTFTEGELAYWLTTRARRAITSEIYEPHLALCTLRLSNHATEPLQVERFAVRVEHLALFGRDDAVWTDEVLVRYEGDEQGSEITFTGRAPDAAGRVGRIAPPRDDPGRGFHARTFGRLRALSGG